MNGEIEYRDILMVVLVLAMVLIVIVEILYLRSRRIKRRLRSGSVLPIKQSKEMIGDEAHNALITGRAIARTLERTGTPMGSAWDLLREAQTAYDRKNYRVCIDLVDKAKDMMKSARLAREKRGDLAKLEGKPFLSAGEEEMLTKEYITKKLPENYMQAKFSIGVARKQIEEKSEAGLDTEAATTILRDAEAAFEAKDYATALKLAIRSKNMVDAGESGLTTLAAEEEVIEVTEEQLKNRCVGCGEFLIIGDNFCRKCGAKIPKAIECEKCGKLAEIDDNFCRKCGAKLPS
ncbi:MAG: zinc ribbon domain-containing protein [Thermoplasmata archaeon]